MIVPRMAKQVVSTPSFPFISGSYRLSKWRLPYLSTTMSFRQAAEHLRLVNEFPGVERLGWRIEEIYQRDVDWPRVERHILPYLRSEDQPQFFNALTVALLPLRQNEVLTEFVDAGWNPPGPLDVETTPHSIDIGGITVSFYEAPGQTLPKLGQVRWNPDELFSVAIDGQHRLAAIKQLVASGRSQASMNETEVPVILLILDPRLGFEGRESRTLVELLRRLFIDLNKHAVKVDRTRQILLDDVDPHSLCVRALVEAQLSNGDGALRVSPPRLPLSLVDWHTGEAKVDSGPYLTTILGLDWAVTKLLGAQPIADYMDYRAVARQLEAFSKSLGLPLEAARARLEDLAQFSIRPFSYLTNAGTGEVEQIASAFSRVWSPAIVQLLTRFGPYAELINVRLTQGTLTTDFTNWFYLYSRQKDERVPGTARREYEQTLTHLANRTETPIPEKRLKEWLAEVESEKSGCLAFNVVFQRALIEAFLHFKKVDLQADESIEIDDTDELLGDSDDEYEEVSERPIDDTSDIDERVQAVADAVSARVNQFVECLNRVTSEEPEWLTNAFAVGAGSGGRRQLWLGALQSLEQKIDFTLGASTRSAEILLWPPLLDADIRSDGIANVASFDTFWQKIVDDGREFSGPQKALRRSLDRYRKATADRILKGDDDYDPLDEADYEVRLNAELKPRLRWVWATVKGAN